MKCYFILKFYFLTQPVLTTVHPLAATMLVLSTDRCISWKISVTIIVLWWEIIVFISFPCLHFFFNEKKFVGSRDKITVGRVTGNQQFFFCLSPSAAADKYSP
jgi:hypothetical protein